MGAKSQTIEAFVQFAKRMGERYDCVQADGGNVAIKMSSGEMLVSQAWGIALSETTPHAGFTSVDYEGVCRIMDHPTVRQAQDRKQQRVRAFTLLADENHNPAIRPSAEVFLHAAFPYQYSAHLHPIAINAIAAHRNARKILAQIFCDQPFYFLDYETPGLAVSMLFYDDSYRAVEKMPRVIVMKNHGLLIGHDDLDALYALIDQVVCGAEQYLGLDYGRYRAVNAISAFYAEVMGMPVTTYLCEDQVVCEAMRNNAKTLMLKPVYPDQYVYNGMQPCVMTSLDRVHVDEFEALYHHKPKVIIYQGQVYFIARNLIEAKEKEAVFKSHVMIGLTVAQESLSVLGRGEVADLSFMG